MNVQVFDTAEQASQAALELFKESVKNGATTFGLATGSTPERLYQLLAESDLDFTDSISINLDEYYGLEADHPQSYHYYMNHHLFQHKPFKASYLPDGSNENSKEEVDRYNRLLEANPIDLQLLGLGANGHIGFNEPGTSFDSKTSLVELTDSTIQANKRFFDSIEEVPKQAYSMGLSSIMAAGKVVLLAFGESKAWAVKQMVEGPVTEDVPASILQNHSNVEILLDQQAAKDLNNQ